jgi:hypothetical protein
MIDAIKSDNNENLKRITSNDLVGAWKISGDKTGVAHFRIETSTLQGEWRTETKIYKFKASKIGAMLVLNLEEEKYLLTGLGLLASGASSPSSPQWVDSTYNKDEIVIRLVITSPNEMVGALAEEAKIEKYRLLRLQK